MGKNSYRFSLNLGLIISGMAAVFSGLLIQIKYHMGHHGHMGIHGNLALNNPVFGMNHEGWADFHKIAIVLFSAFMICHILQHWKWYKMVIRKRLISRNRQVIVLSAIFVLVAITGFIPWLIDLWKGNEMLRKVFIEIHDKLALILMVYLVLHITKRLKWFITTFEKMVNTPRTQHRLEG